MSQSRWKGPFCKQNKLAESANFVFKFKAKHAIEEQSQCLEESQHCFESKVAEAFRFIDLNFLIEQLRRCCHTSIISLPNLENLYFQGKSNKNVKINVKYFGSTAPFLSYNGSESTILCFPKISLFTISRQSPLSIKIIIRYIAVKSRTLYRLVIYHR